MVQRQQKPHSRSATVLTIVLLSIFCMACDAWVSNPAVRAPLSLTGPNGGGTKLYSTTSNRSGRQRSRVSDPDGPTPEMEQDEEEEIDPHSVDGIREIMSQDELPRPIPHQPWRRGNTDGCEAPIDAEWRQSAERIIATAVKLVGGQLLDVTWYLTSIVVTIDEDITIDQRDMFKAEGPIIEVEKPREPIYCDPTDPNPDDISASETGVMYDRQTEEEQEEAKIKDANRWAAKDEDDLPEEPHNPLEASEPKSVLFKNEVTRPDYAMRGLEEEKIRMVETPKRADLSSLHRIDTAALSTIAGVILQALEEVEDDLRVLERHELVLASPGAPDVLETQKQFNAYRGENVIVETQDPWESNRTLKGKLVDRNAMDVLINQKGRLVTIPNCFVKCVRIPAANVGSTSLTEEE
mmetsp:Transcript_689/g.1669  ORF Transcript_689/g.1669 Transcript_689/m.1669 type:complete len:409 (-) Transcript_689:670-1896(-)